MINSHVPWPVHPTSQIKAVQKIVRGSRTPGLGLNCYIDARNGIILGDNVLIGPKVSIISMNHDISDFENYVIGKPIIIGNDCWLGAGCIILPEVILGPKTIVGAGTVVTKSFPEGEQLLVGNPARIVKKI
ncbi:acyltransferase [Vibrio sp. C8]